MPRTPHPHRFARPPRELFSPHKGEKKVVSQNGSGERNSMRVLVVGWVMAR